jgi:hypothetical protein
MSQQAMSTAEQTVVFTTPFENHSSRYISSHICSVSKGSFPTK